MRLTRLGVFSVAALAILVVVGLTTLLIFLTPLRTLVPDYGDTSLRSVGEYNAIVMDSLERGMQQQEQYLQNMQAILNNTIGEEDTFSRQERTPGVYDTVPLENSEEDSAFRREVESETVYALTLGEDGAEKSNVYFFTPVRGRITRSFNGSEAHFGVDVAASENESVKATLNGTVVFASWTAENGHEMHLQHANNYLSIYKHNATLHKVVGDRVKAGENIAIIGNSGEHSSGPHLHFELWHNGIPVDPQEVIVFE